MGNAAGTELAKRNRLDGKDVFTAEEREELLGQFKKLDSRSRGYIPKMTLLKSLSHEVAAMPLVEQMVDALIRRRVVAQRGMVTMTKRQRMKAFQIVYPQDMLAFASLMSPKEHVKRKLEVLFEVFDTDSDGYCDAEDVQRVFKQMYGTAHSDAQYAEMATACLVQCDVNADGVVSFREFARMMSHQDLSHLLSRIM